MLPSRNLVAALALLGALARLPAAAATLSVSVLLPDGRPLAGAVITVHSLDAAAPAAPAVRAIMDQVNMAFAPDVLVIPVGSTVAFPNTDTTRHQVYSFSPAKSFQLPLYRGNPNPPVLFDKAGLVTLGCNIHDNMLAYIVVTDAQFYGRTDSAGTWSAAAVPGGRYRIEVWYPRLREAASDLQRELTLGETDRSAITLQLTKQLRPAPLEAHPHSWDSY